MTQEQLYNRIRGSLTAAALGDALGAPSEGMSAAEIHAYYGGRIDTFLDGAVNPYFHNARVGEVTDDTSQMMEMAKAVIKANGNFTVADAANGLLSWAENCPKYFPLRAGPTTRLIIEALRRGEDPVAIGRGGGAPDGTPERGSTNGAAMRVAAAGLVHPGDIDAAIQDAITMTCVSHGTQLGFASACAVAAGIAAALVDKPDIYHILRACIYGAEKGDTYGRTYGRVAPGTSVRTKLLKAIAIAYDSECMEQAEQRLNDEVGADSSAAASAIAVAIGLFTAADSDPKRTLLGAANVGADTDTIGCIAGMLVGATVGYDALPKDWCATLEQVNPDFDFHTTATQLTAIASRK